MGNEFVLNVGQGSVTVGTASVNLSLPTNRMSWYIKNTSTTGQIITIGLGKVPTSLNGAIVLNAGDSYADTNSEGYVCWQGTINAISSAGSGAVVFSER